MPVIFFSPQFGVHLQFDVIKVCLRKHVVVKVTLRHNIRCIVPIVHVNHCRKLLPAKNETKGGG